MPLWFATGAGAVSRRIIGTVVIGGMLAATCVAVCLIPVTFYVVEKFAGAPRRELKPESNDARRECTGKRGMSSQSQCKTRLPAALAVPCAALVRRLRGWPQL